MKRASVRVNRARQQALRASSRLVHADHSLLSRRFEAQEVVLDRINEDRLLRGISDNLRGNSVRGFEAARDRLNEVLLAWRELLGS